MIDKRMRLQSGGPPGGGDKRMTYDAGAANRENRRTSQYNSSPSKTSSQTTPERNRPNPNLASGQSIDTYITPQQVKASREFKRQQDEQRSNTGGLNTLAKTALSFLIPGSGLLMNQGIGNAIGNTLGDFRQKFTGYRTQAEYDAARQQRRNLNRIRTIQNTLNTKYADGDYSNTDLDERLAGLQSLMGIVPNTAEQDAQQFLDFGNELAETTEAPSPTLDLSKLETGDLNNLASLIESSKQPQSNFEYLGPNFDEGLLMDYQDIGVASDGYNYPDRKQLVNSGTITPLEDDFPSEGIMSQVDDIPTDLEIFKKRFP